MLSVSFFPWRHASANICDRVVSISVLTLVFLALSNAAMGGESPETEQWAIMLSFAPFPVFVIQVLALSAKGFTRTNEQIKSRHRVISVHLHNMFQSVADMKQNDLVDLLGRITAHDRKALLSAADLILAEIHGQQPRASRTAQRLIISELIKPLDEEHRDQSGLWIAPKYDTSMAQAMFLDKAAPASQSFQIVKALVTGKHGEHFELKVPPLDEPKSTSQAKREGELLKSELQSKDAVIVRKDSELVVLNSALNRTSQALDTKESELQERDDKLMKLTAQVAEYRSGLSEAGRQLKLTADYHDCMKIQMQTQHLNHQLLVNTMQVSQTPRVQTPRIHGKQHTSHSPLQDTTQNAFHPQSALNVAPGGSS